MLQTQEGVIPTWQDICWVIIQLAPAIPACSLVLLLCIPCDVLFQGTKIKNVSTVGSVKTNTRELHIRPEGDLEGHFLEIHIYRTFHGGVGLSRSGCGLVGVCH